MYANVQSDPCQPCGGGHSTGLEYVGQGRGDFAMEPHMKFGGDGGDYSTRRAAGFPCCLFMLPLLLLSLLSLLCLWLFWPVDECKTGLDNYQLEWNQDKIYRCCSKGLVPCPPVAAGAPAQQGPVDPYNCALGLLNWQAGWSTEKKQWCCNEHGKGCGHDGPAVANMYDCNDGTENWVRGWSDNKKQYCCSHGYKGCPQDAAMVAGTGYGAGSHGGATPFGAPEAGHEAGFVPYGMATQGYGNR
jgi:hypothetical protein